MVKIEKVVGLFFFFKARLLRVSLYPKTNFGTFHKFQQ